MHSTLYYTSIQIYVMCRIGRYVLVPWFTLCSHNTRKTSVGRREATWTVNSCLSSHSTRIYRTPGESLPAVGCVHYQLFRTLGMALIRWSPATGLRNVIASAYPLQMFHASFPFSLALLLFLPLKVPRKVSRNCTGIQMVLTR